MELQKVVEDADRFRVLAPSGAHTRFRLQKRNARSGKWKTIKLEALDKINRSFLSDNSTKEKSKEKCQLLLKELYTARDSLKPVAVFHSENINILKSYWKEKYPPRKQKRMVAPEAAYGDLKRAIEACENLPLDSVLADTLQDHIDEKFSTQTNKQRRICVWLNMILKWLDRDFKLEGFPPERKNIKHLTLQEFNKVVPYFKRWDMKVLARVAFHTGLRQGECFAIELSNIREKTLLVSSQLDRYKEIT